MRGLLPASRREAARAIVAACAAALLALAAPAAPARDTGAGVRLVDDWSRSLSLAARPSRIVSLAPHATELLFASGAGPAVIAVDRNSDYPAAVRSLARLSSFPQPDAERLLALRPDLVVVWGPGISRTQLERLSALGVAVFVSDPQRLDDVVQTMRRFATLAEEPQRGLAGADAFEDRLASIRARYSGREPVRVFVEIWSTPLVSLDDRGVIGDAIRSCGGVNVFGDAPVAAPHLDPEAVLAARPQLVIATDGEQSVPRWSALGLLAPHGPARFVAFDASTMQRPGPRSIVALERLCAEIDSVRMSAR